MTVPQQDTLEATLAGFDQGEGLGVHSLWSSQPVGGFDALMVLALVTARAVQAAAAAAPGRTVLGVRAGHRTWGGHEYEQRFDRSVRQVTDWIGTVRRLLDGEALTATDNAFGLTVAATDITVATPIVLAATGPKMLAAGGRVADGFGSPGRFLKHNGA